MSRAIDTSSHNNRFSNSSGDEFVQRIHQSPHLASVSQWIGNRQVVLKTESRQVNQQRWLAIVASHRQANRETSPAWREAIESAMRRCRGEDLALLICRDTPVGDYLIHVARRFALTTIELFIPRPHEPFSAWQSKICSSMQRTSESQDPNNFLSVSPIIDDGPNLPVHVEGPLADLAMIAMADFVHAIDIRKNGRIDRIVRHRLSCSEYPLGTVAVDLTPPADIDAKPSSMIDLMDLGAVGWVRPSRYDLAKYDLENPMVSADESSESNVPPILELPANEQSSSFPASKIGGRSKQAFSPVFSNRLVTGSSPKVDTQWTYLTHCTRSPSGPWPDQSLAGYYDEMLTESSHSQPLDTLLRILQQQKLIATSYLKRTNVATVSFSEVPLQELLARRTFQRHLHRWDWEPYGICIQNRWLEKQGCRIVTYGTKSDFQNLQRDDQPFFQVIPDGSTWEHEREWRIADDLRLAEIPATEAFVFVPTVADGHRVSSVSRFPVMIVESCTEPKLH